jgi:hypothetical protein
MVSPGDHELDRALAELGGFLAYPPTPDIASGVLQRLATEAARPRPFARLQRLWDPLVPAQRVWDRLVPVQRRLAVALVALIVVAAAVLAASPEARTAVADRLGLRGVQIQQVPAVPTLPATAPVPSLAAVSSPASGASPAAVSSPNAASPATGSPAAALPGAASPGSRLRLGQPMTLDQVRARVAYPVGVPAALGAPDEVYLSDAPVGGQVALVYNARADLPQANTTGVGVLLTQFQGTVHSTAAVGKGLPPGTRLEQVEVNGGQGYWIDGDPHAFFYLDARGQVQTETTRLAANVLLWEQADQTFRLESALPKAAALQIARSLQIAARAPPRLATSPIRRPARFEARTIDAE